MDKEKSKLALKHLIDRYDSNKNSKDFTGNESQIRRSLIEPFVRDVLGWNIEDPSEFKVESLVSGKRSCDNTIIVGVPYINLKNVNNKHVNKYIKNLNLNRIEVEKISENFNLRYILSIINSKLMFYFLKFNSGGKIDTYPDDWKKIPIKIIPPEKQLPFIQLADKMLSLNKKLQEEKLSQHEKEKIRQEIKKTDNEIDELAYQLYGITEEEKKIIEESLK